MKSFFVPFSDRRSAVIRELLRITAPGGFVMIHAWAKEQGEDSKHNFPDSVREKLSFDNYLFFY